MQISMIYIFKEHTKVKIIFCKQIYFNKKSYKIENIPAEITTVSGASHSVNRGKQTKIIQALHRYDTFKFRSLYLNIAD